MWRGNVEREEGLEVKRIKNKRIKKRNRNKW